MMSSKPTDQTQTEPQSEQPPRAPLSLRAKILQSLEKWFPPREVPRKNLQMAQHAYAKAKGSYQRQIEELGGIGSKTVLDFGCGTGGETLWLAERSTFAVGCDVKADSLAEAQQFKLHSQHTNVSFVEVPHNTLPFSDNSFDAIFSTDVFEHVMQPGELLSEIYRVLTPGGSFISTFGPLFYSPLGYHMLRVSQVPYAHIFFGIKPIVEIRNTRDWPVQISTWQEFGLNQITFTCFKRLALSGGFQPIRLKRLSVRRTSLLARLPWIGNLFTFGVDCHLLKPETR